MHMAPYCNQQLLLSSFISAGDLNAFRLDIIFRRVALGSFNKNHAAPNVSPQQVTQDNIDPDIQEIVD